MCGKRASWQQLAPVFRFFGGFSDEIEIELTIARRKEDILTIVTALCDVIWLASEDKTGIARHLN